MRLTVFIIVFILTTLVPLPVAIVAMLAYSVRWPGLELLVLGAGLDAFFGAAASYPTYTLGAAMMLVVVTWLRPLLSVYNE